MRAMVLERQGLPLVARELPVPVPSPGQLLIKVRTCGVCRTDLHVADGDLPDPKLPLVLGHEVVGTVERLDVGENPFGFHLGDRVGVPWLSWTCGHCRYCRSGRENLCAAARFTGFHRDGGFAEYCLADQRYCFHLPAQFDDLHAAPLLCAGLIGYRAYTMVAGACHIGFYGFGASAHILAQIAAQQGRQVYAFTRPGDSSGQAFARSLGVSWAGASGEKPPQLLDAAIIFAPAGELVPMALESVHKAGVVVCAGIHMSDIPSFPYAHLWNERSIRSVANLTRRDGEEFFALVNGVTLRTEVTPYPLEEANLALDDLRQGRLNGAAVLKID